MGNTESANKSQENKDKMYPFLSSSDSSAKSVDGWDNDTVNGEYSSDVESINWEETANNDIFYKTYINLSRSYVINIKT